MCDQVGNDIRQVLHAMQMWRAKSQNMRYTELKENMQRIEKDKVERNTLSPVSPVSKIRCSTPPSAYSLTFSP